MVLRMLITTKPARVDDRRRLRASCDTASAQSDMHKEADTYIHAPPSVSSSAWSMKSAIAPAKRTTLISSGLHSDQPHATCLPATSRWLPPVNVFQNPTVVSPTAMIKDAGTVYNSKQRDVVEKRHVQPMKTHGAHAGKVNPHPLCRLRLRFSASQVQAEPKSAIGTVVASPKFPQYYYQIDRVIQTAIYGAVFLAYECCLNSRARRRKVALKVLLRGLERQHRGNLQEDSRAEIRFRDLMNGHQFEDLFEVLRKRHNPFSEGEARWLFQQLLSATEFLHRRGLAFRDHSLENVLVFNDEAEKVIIPKITDPGQAVRLEYDPQGRIKELAVEKLFGKSFRPPEVYAKGTYNPIKVDVFCIGWMLFFAVTKQQAFDRALSGDTCWCLMMKKKYQELLRKRGGSFLSPELQDLLWHMLDPNPNTRLTPCECLSHSWFQGTFIPIDEHRLLERPPSKLTRLPFASQETIPPRLTLSTRASLPSLRRSRPYVGSLLVKTPDNMKGLNAVPPSSTVLKSRAQTRQPSGTREVKTENNQEMYTRKMMSHSSKYVTTASTSSNDLDRVASMTGSVETAVEKDEIAKDTYSEKLGTDTTVETAASLPATPLKRLIPSLKDAPLPSSAIFYDVSPEGVASLISAAREEPRRRGTSKRRSKTKQKPLLGRRSAPVVETTSCAETLNAAVSNGQEQKSCLRKPQSTETPSLGSSVLRDASVVLTTNSSTTTSGDDFSRMTGSTKDLQVIDSLRCDAGEPGQVLPPYLSSRATPGTHSGIQHSEAYASSQSGGETDAVVQSEPTESLSNGINSAETAPSTTSSPKLAPVPLAPAEKMRHAHSTTDADVEHAESIAPSSGVQVDWNVVSLFSSRSSSLMKAAASSKGDTIHHAKLRRKKNRLSSNDSVPQCESDFVPQPNQTDVHALSSIGRGLSCESVQEKRQPFVPPCDATPWLFRETSETGVVTRLGEDTPAQNTTRRMPSTSNQRLDRPIRASDTVSAPAEPQAYTRQTELVHINSYQPVQHFTFSPDDLAVRKTYSSSRISVENASLEFHDVERAGKRQPNAPSSRTVAVESSHRWTESSVSPSSLEDAQSPTAIPNRGRSHSTLKESKGSNKKLPSKNSSKASSTKRVTPQQGDRASRRAQETKIQGIKQTSIAPSCSAVLDVIYPDEENEKKFLFHRKHLQRRACSPLQSHHLRRRNCSSEEETLKAGAELQSPIGSPMPNATAMSSRSSEQKHRTFLSPHLKISRRRPEESQVTFHVSSRTQSSYNLVEQPLSSEDEDVLNATPSLETAIETIQERTSRLLSSSSFASLSSDQCQPRVLRFPSYERQFRDDDTPEHIRRCPTEHLEKAKPLVRQIQIPTELRMNMRVYQSSTFGSTQATHQRRDHLATQLQLSERATTLFAEILNKPPTFETPGRKILRQTCGPTYTNSVSPRYMTHNQHQSPMSIIHRLETKNAQSRLGELVGTPRPFSASRLLGPISCQEAIRLGKLRQREPPRRSMHATMLRTLSPNCEGHQQTQRLRERRLSEAKILESPRNDQHSVSISRMTHHDRSSSATGRHDASILSVDLSAPSHDRMHHQLMVRDDGVPLATASRDRTLSPSLSSYVSQSAGLSPRVGRCPLLSQTVMRYSVLRAAGPQTSPLSLTSNSPSFIQSRGTVPSQHQAAKTTVNSNSMTIMSSLPVSTNPPNDYCLPGTRQPRQPFLACNRTQDASTLQLFSTPLSSDLHNNPSPRSYPPEQPLAWTARSTPTACQKYHTLLSYREHPVILDVTGSPVGRLPVLVRRNEKPNSQVQSNPVSASFFV